MNKTSDVIPSFKITDTTCVPISLEVGEILNVLPKNVTKEGNTGVIETRSESMSKVVGSV